jgi:hypothetical protein
VTAATFGLPPRRLKPRRLLGFAVVFAGSAVLIAQTLGIAG